MTWLPFFGEEALPLGVALGVGVFTGGTGIIPSMLFMAAAGAGGKAIDELIVEKAEGHQKQTDEEIYGDIGKWGLYYGLGEGIGPYCFWHRTISTKRQRSGRRSRCS